MLDAPLDILRVRQYFNAITMARDVAIGIRDDAGFLDAVRRATFLLPFEREREVDPRPFPPLTVRAQARYRGRRVAVVASGGSGALASLVGVARALEEAGIRPAAYSLCSGSALFGFPLAAGHSAEEVAAFTLSMRVRDRVDPDWTKLLSVLPNLFRGFTGVLRGDRLEAAYDAWFEGMTLGEMPIPAYAPVWNVEHNRVEYIGPRTHPRMTVAHAIRMAVALPLFAEAVVLDGGHYYDGGTVDVFPVSPLLDIEDAPDMAVAVNCFYPSGFEGEDITGWERRRGSIFIAAAQVRSCQHMELARENLARLRAEVGEVLLVEPVPYSVIKGAGLYRQFVDSSQWPGFMRAGRQHTHRALLTAARSDGAARRSHNGAGPPAITTGRLG